MNDSQSLEPIKHRIGLNGSIEYIKLDGETYYYAYDNIYNIVITPLISDADEMALFASKYVQEMEDLNEGDNYKPVSFWQESITEANESPDIGIADDESSTFTTEEMQSIKRLLEVAKVENIPVTSLDINYHMYFILTSSCGWLADVPHPADPALPEVLNKMGILDGGDAIYEIENAISYLRGEEDASYNGEYSDAATFVIEYLDIVVNNAPSNWKNYFSPLVTKQA